RENRTAHDNLVAALLEHESLDEQQAYEAAGLEHKPAPQLLVGARPTTDHAEHRSDAQRAPKDNSDDLKGYQDGSRH
ncbi:MAG TPA: hypothetical protein VIG82_00805, partial [Enteractinococcus sp.]